MNLAYCRHKLIFFKIIELYLSVVGNKLETLEIIEDLGLVEIKVELNSEVEKDFELEIGVEVSSVEEIFEVNAI